MTAVAWRPYRAADCLVVAPRGELDARTYREFRTELIKFAMDQPRAVIVVLDDLHVASLGSLTALSSAWMQVSDWPGVPIVLVAREEERCRALRGTAIARYLPVQRSVSAALDGLRDPPRRRRTEIELFPVSASSRLARVFVRTTCVRWNVADCATEAAEVATELVENGIIHANTDLRLRLELHHGGLTIAVRDGSPREAVLRERADRPATGLHLVAVLATTWGCAPDSSGGKIVWAVLPAAGQLAGSHQ